MIDAVIIGLISFVFIELLCEPFEVFGWWPPLLRKIVLGSPAIVDYENLAWWQLAIVKPLSGCGKCFAGWLSVVYFINWEAPPLMNLIPFVCLAIFTAWVLEQFKIRIEA